MTPSQERLSRIPGAVLDDLKRRYAEPQRHYHSWLHIAALLGWFDQRAAGLFNADAVFLAVLFHDAIYDPKAKDNEAASARLLAATALPGWEQDAIDRAVVLTEATAAHRIPDDLAPQEQADLAEFLDMDLSILGASSAAFDAYDRAIRKEYRHVLRPLYEMGRRKILAGFLKREHLYLSDWGRASFEARARDNLERRVGVGRRNPT
ncbi:hypothetical protein ACO2Q1_00985 [Brevundimonas sp. VNH65]|uniref:HD domain-containing protein n=1 Tax=Brevundimonas sp. VNH65 TaxID=3400917 RepID=UPI003BFCB658